MRNITLIILSIIMLINFSCETYYDLEIDTSTEVNVNSLLVAGEPIVVTVSLSKKLSDPISHFPFALITNALVIIESDLGENDTLKLTTNYNTYTSSIYGKYDTVYYTDRVIPKPGHWYRLKVYVSGFDTVYAETYVPYRINLLNFYYLPTETDRLRIFGTIKDSTGEDFYLFITKYTIGYSNDPATSLVRSFGILLDDKLFDGENYTYIFEINKNPNVEEEIIFCRANKDFYLYVMSYYTSLKPELYNPFNEPVVVYNNIENGLGIFAAITPSDTLIIQKTAQQ